MADKSNIEWTEATWNPVTGCSKVSPGCAHCYAETLTMRFARAWGVPGLPWTPKNAAVNVVMRPERLSQPVRWTRPRMIFVNSMSDVFHELLPVEYTARIFAVMALAPWHTFQVLTKRPEVARDVLNWTGFPGMVRDEAVKMRREGLLPTSAAVTLALENWGTDVTWPLRNVWLGTSIENRRYVKRADDLRLTPAAVRFISAEPLLGPLVPDSEWAEDAEHERYPYWDAHIGARRLWADEYRGPGLDLTGIDWLIVGGESGKIHRPMKEEWVRDLRDICETDAWEWDHDGHTALFVKQMGGLRPGTALEDLPNDLRVREFPEVVTAVR